MTGLINSFGKQIRRIFWKNNYYTAKPPTKWISRACYSTDNTVSEAQIKTILKERFPGAIDIQVADVSGGCGAMFEIYVETPDFKGLPIVKQHKSVYDALSNEIKQIHGLHLVTKAPP